VDNLNKHRPKRKRKKEGRKGKEKGRRMKF
jgi:hypothetical protein